jgi:hypothetical protein
MNYKICLLIVIVLSGSLCTTAQKITFDKTPEWVKPIDIPANSSVTKYDILSGYYYTLADIQANLGENSIYHHEVASIISYSGITEASQLMVTFDTTYEKLIIHHLFIWRKGEKIDRTSLLSFEILNNENNLGQGIYTGQISAYDILDDIRKDDLIDFAYTLTGNNPIFDDEKFLFFPLESLNPLDFYSLRIIYQADKDYSYECEGCDSLISIIDTGGYRQIEYQKKNVRGIKYEDNMVTWEMPYKYFILSSMKSWRDVNAWAMKVFALNKEPDLDEVFDEVLTGDESTETKINKLIDYVQDDIRYMGIESGIGSIKPFPPEQVVKQRFGDCKDKSLLLVSLLKQTGVPNAYPVLINTDLHNTIEEFFPSNQCFTHCIVAFEYDNNFYWVDPTLTLQGGGFKSLNNFDYGKALIIGLPADSLQNMAPIKSESMLVVIDEYTMNSFSEPAGLKMISTRHGLESDVRRAFFEYFSIDNISDGLEKSLGLVFPLVEEVSDPEIFDDAENNIFTVKYNYRVDGFWQDGDKGTNTATNGFWVFRYEPVMLYQDLSLASCEGRQYDYQLMYPMNLDYRVIFHFPKEILIEDEYDVLDNQGFTYEEKTEQLSSNSIMINYKLKTKSNFIKAEDYKEMCEQTNAIINGFPIVFYFSK